MFAFSQAEIQMHHVQTNSNVETRTCEKFEKRFELKYVILQTSVERVESTSGLGRSKVG